LQSASTSRIERFSHLFLSGETAAPTPAPILKLPFSENRELLSFFGLKENPFIDTVNPSAYFPTPQHERAYTKMLHSIEDGISMGLLTAPSGMGKTLLISLLKQVIPQERNQVVSLQIDKSLTKAAFLKNLLYYCGFHKIYEGQHTYVNDLMVLLENKIKKNFQDQGKRLVILLDEAQFLSLELLYTIKIISNMELPERKLVTVILFGEESLWRRLQQKSFLSLVNRMFVREELHPLSLAETTDYLNNKTREWGFMRSVFTPEMAEVIYVATDGICREINSLMYNALLEAYAMKKQIIDHDVLLRCLN
jgi:general secretion pathway protein A